MTMHTNLSGEYEACLRRAVVDRKMRTLCVWGRRQEFIFNALAYGQQRGWLGKAEDVGDEQSGGLALKLTDAGADYFGVPRDEVKA